MDGRPGLGPAIAVGRTAEIYAWDADRVVKLLRPGFDPRLLAEEAATSGLVTALGMPAPRFHGSVEVGGASGLLFDRADGPAMVEAILRAPWRSLGLADRLADLHAQIHTTPIGDAPGLRDARDALAHAVRAARPRIGDRATGAALGRLEALPAGDALLHGDFHPGNVLLSAAGPRVIDWLTAVRGRPAADVARTCFLVRDAAVDDVSGLLGRLELGIVRRRFVARYLRRYRQRTGLAHAELRAWRLPILVARGAEDVASEADLLPRLIERELRRD